MEGNPSVSLLNCHRNESPGDYEIWHRWYARVYLKSCLPVWIWNVARFNPFRLGSRAKMCLHVWTHVGHFFTVDIFFAHANFAYFLCVGSNRRLCRFLMVIDEQSDDVDIVFLFMWKRCVVVPQIMNLRTNRRNLIREWGNSFWVFLYQFQINWWAEQQLNHVLEKLINTSLIFTNKYACKLLQFTTDI